MGLEDERMRLEPVSKINEMKRKSSVSADKEGTERPVGLEKCHFSQC